MPKHETRNILLNNLGSKQSVNEIWPDYVTIQKQKLINKFCENYGLKTSSRSFVILKESSVKSNLSRLGC